MKATFTAKNNRDQLANLITCYVTFVSVLALRPAAVPHVASVNDKFQTSRQNYCCCM